MVGKTVSGFFLLVAALLLIAAPCPAEERFDVPLGASQQKGPADAPVTLIEFLDFQ